MTLKAQTNELAIILSRHNPVKNIAGFNKYYRSLRLKPPQAASVLTLTDLDWSDEGTYFCTSSYPGFPYDTLYNATLSIRGGVESGDEDCAATFSCKYSGATLVSSSAVILTALLMAAFF